MPVRGLAWALAAVGFAALVGATQIPGRAPLVWDEAARVETGTRLAYALQDLDPGALWTWFTTQYYYPFLEPALHGLAYLVTGGDEVAAAWVPGLLAYGAAGILVGRVGAAIGGGEAAGWVAALLFWLTPIEAKVAAGAFTEPLGVCVEAGVLLALTAHLRGGGWRAALLAGGLTGVAWCLKYDYGLLATATLGATAVVSAATARDLRVLIPYAAATAIALAILAATVVPGWSVTGEQFVRYLTQDRGGPGIGEPATAQKDVDFLYYPRTMFSGGLLPGRSDEVGLTAPLAALLLVALGWGIYRGWRHAHVRPTVFYALLWLGLYSQAQAKFPRYAAMLVPALAILAGPMLVEGWRWLRVRGARARRVAVAAVALLSLLLVLELPRLWDRFGFLDENVPVERAIAFISPRLPASNEKNRELLMIGQTNAFNQTALKIAWTGRLDEPAYGVEVVPEALPEERAQALFRTLFWLRPVRVVGATPRPGSRFDTLDFHQVFPSQLDYFRIAGEFERQGLLRRIGSRDVGDGLTITMWALGDRFEEAAKAIARRLELPVPPPPLTP